MTAPATTTGGPAPAPPDPAPGTALSPDARGLWLRARGYLVALTALVTAGLLLAVLTTGEDGALDPRSATPPGSRALAELLADHGVDVTLVTTTREAAAATGPDTTLLVTRPEALTARSRDLLAPAAADSGGRTVLVAPGPEALAAFVAGARVAAPVGTGEREPECASPTARRAGSVRLGGYRYVPLPGTSATGCYPADGLPTLLTLPAGEGDTVLLGASGLLTNEHLDEDGNASLALQLLGSRTHLTWFLPGPDEAPAAGEGTGLTGLIDPGWRWAALQLAIAAALAALWRGRRLGPVVTERLPVVVRAAETTEGRARLYHRASARDRAADALRAAARGRLAPLTGVPPAQVHDPATLPGAVAAHTGAEPRLVSALLFGPPPPDDSALVRLADDLDTLERRVRPRSARGTETGRPAQAGPTAEEKESGT